MSPTTAARKGSLQIASMIADFARDKSFDMIFTGMQSQDRGSAQVGVMVAELLGHPCVTTIVDFALANGMITVKRELEGGVKAVVEAALRPWSPASWASIRPATRPCPTS